MSECSSPQIRGLLGSLPAMFMAFGISGTYLMGAFLPWDILSYFCAVIPFIGCVAMLIMPESPLWLASKGLHTEATEAALWLKNEAILDSITGGKNTGNTGEK